MKIERAIENLETLFGEKSHEVKCIDDEIMWYASRTKFVTNKALREFK
jgi:hypothetical protein